jgi:hypothetical protein
MKTQLLVLDKPYEANADGTVGNWMEVFSDDETGREVSLDPPYVDWTITQEEYLESLIEHFGFFQEG